jgi:hydroxyethylthiazole kinase-like uncharacterized protein yjeF
MQRRCQSWLLQMKTLTKEIIKHLIKSRKETSNKGDYGHSFLIAGKQNKMGAAVIASRACLRAGTGLLSVSVPETERLILQVAVPEAMVVIRKKDEDNLNSFSAVGIGCGIGIDKESAQIVSFCISDCSKPLVIDADALNIISAIKNWLNKIPANTILTPHPKEFDRLFGNHQSVEARVKTAIEKANELELVIVLKGHKTLVTASGEAFLNTTGNAGLAKGGSGDALTGIITAFLAQGYAPFDAAKIGVYLHGLAADLALDKQSKESMLITDVVENLGKAFKLINV